MTDLIRESALGQTIRFLTGNRVFKYPEELPGFKLPDVWVQLLNSDNDANNLALRQSLSARRTRIEKRERRGNSSSASSETADEEAAGIKENEKTLPAPSSSDDDAITAKDIDPYAIGRAGTQVGGSEPGLGLTRSRSREETVPYSRERLEVDELHEVEKTKSVPVVPHKTRDGVILVDWYYSDDPANPQNWSNGKRLLVSFIICLYTFVVYMSSAIYTTSEIGVMEEFGVSKTQSALGLSLFVLGYGLGPLLFSPLSEIPVIGRNPIYIVTMFLYVIISIPAAVPHNYAGLMVLRFLQGFFGSPCLASGGASFQDMYSLLNLGYALIAWTAAAYCGPALGPLLSGFSVPVKGWRWSLLEILWASAPVFVAMFIILPETSTPNILLRRARRLRKLTGSDRFMSQSEIDQKNMKASAVAIDALIKPIEITIKDPAIMFVQLYTAIIYGIYYSFFESFPLVYPVFYHMNSGQIGLVFLCVLVSCLIGIAMYISYLYFYMIPRIMRSGMPRQEVRLVPALFAAFGPTIGLFIFAWTADPRFPWIAPTIGITVYGATVFVSPSPLLYLQAHFPQPDANRICFSIGRHAVHLHIRAALVPSVRRFALCRQRLLPFRPRLRLHPLREAALRQSGRCQGHLASRWAQCYWDNRHLAAVLLWCTSAEDEQVRHPRGRLLSDDGQKLAGWRANTSWRIFYGHELEM